MSELSHSPALRQTKRLSARRWASAPDAMSGDLEKWYVYNRLPAIAINQDNPTMETRRQADILFDRLELRGYKRHDKREFFSRLVQAGKRAYHVRGCVMCPRHPQLTSRARLQVIDAAADAGLFASYRSPPGSPRMSRLVPLMPLAEITEADPWTFDPVRPQQLVFLRRRDDEQDEIAFDTKEPIPAGIQERLELVNEINNRFEITYEPYDEWEDCHRGQRQLRPVHYARFTDDWEHHGRLYTGKYGHQSLRKLERQTIRFGREVSVELDYGGLHTRMLYHLAGKDYEGDPYALWGDDTTKPLRKMAKAMVNAAINAKSRTAAISACNHQMSPKTADGAWKTGKEWQKAAMLRRASHETGVKFATIYDLALQHHAPIADGFGSDAGMMLMNLDGQIALDILFCFARHGVPCLGCHDSFIVPVSYKDKLRSAMMHYYRRRLGYDPEVSE